MDLDTTAHESIETRVGRALGDTVVRSRTLTGGMIGDVVRIELAAHPVVVAKSSGPDGKLTLEATMLRHLHHAGAIPVPRVLHAEDDLLVIEFIEGEHVRPVAEPHLGTLLADLHDVTGNAFGFESETLNGRIILSNPWSSSWVSFFGEHRLQFSLALVDRYHPLPPETRTSLDTIVERLPRLLTEPDRPSLLHGDLWAANVLSQDDRVTAFLDPSACYGHPELELAYVDAWGSFGDGFWNAYLSRHPLAHGFEEVRRHVYALYPLLMHVYYFGDRFVPKLQATIDAIRPHL